jgi:hypothetical protein
MNLPSLDVAPSICLFGHFVHIYMCSFSVDLYTHATKVSHTTILVCTSTCTVCTSTVPPPVQIYFVEFASCFPMTRRQCHFARGLMRCSRELNIFVKNQLFLLLKQAVCS